MNKTLEALHKLLEEQTKEFEGYPDTIENHKKRNTILAKITETTAKIETMEKSENDKPITITIDNDTQAEATEKFNSQKLLESISDYFELDHLGNTKQRMLTFLTAISGHQANSNYRFSTAINGDSTEGKTNMMLVVSYVLLESWYYKYDSITKSALEDKLRKHPEIHIVLFSEVNKTINVESYEFIKSLCEDGYRGVKRDVSDTKMGVISTTIGKISGIYSTCELIPDDELDNRFLNVTIVNSANQNELINNHIIETFGNSETLSGAEYRKATGSWVKYGLYKLLGPINAYTIPCRNCIKVNCGMSRSKRDLKRYLSLICAIAWLHQLKREIRVDKNGKTVLTVTPEDCINAYNIMATSLKESNQSFTARDKSTLTAIRESSKEQTIKLSKDEKVTGKFAEKREVMVKLNIRSRRAIQKRLASLRELDAIDSYYVRSEHKYYISIREDVVSWYQDDFILDSTVKCLQEQVTQPENICFKDTIDSTYDDKEKLDKKSLNQKMFELKGVFESKDAVTFPELLQLGYDEDFISGCIDRKLLIPYANGKLMWNGGDICQD